MSISLSIDRNITVLGVDYEVSAYGDRVFNFRTSALIEGSYKDDIEMIFMQCRNEKNIDLFEIESVLMKLQIAHELYQIVWSKKCHNVLNIFIGTNIFRRYIYSFDDLSKKEENTVDLYFNEWVEAAMYIQDTITKNSNEAIPNKLNNPKITRSLNADIGSLIIPQNQEVHIPRNTLSVKFISFNDKKITLELSFKQGDEYLKKNVVINAAYPLHIYEAIKKSKLFKDLSYKYKYIIYVSNDEMLSFLINCRNEENVSLQKGTVAIGSINPIQHKISEKLQDILEEYPHIKRHINDWIETFKEFYSDNASSKQCDTNIKQLPKYTTCHIYALIINDTVELRWNSLSKDANYILYRQQNGKDIIIAKISNKDENVYSFKVQPGEEYKYAVVGVFKNSSHRLINDIHLQASDFITFTKQSLIEVNQPQVSAGNVYYINNSSCNHRLWQVIYCDNVQANIICRKCGLKRKVSCNYILNKCRFAYFCDTPTYSDIISSSSVSKRRISQIDVIVLSSTKHCTNLNHNVIDYIGVLPIATEKGVNNLELNICYCWECNKYIMLTSTYLKIKGDPICMVKDQRTNKILNKPYDGFWLNSTEHIIHQYGYNVRSGNGMLSTDRQEILAKIINNGVLSKNEIISHLEYCIRMASGRETMSSAIRKWQQDIEFVRKYNIKAEKVAVNSITLKYRK